MSPPVAESRALEIAHLRRLEAEAAGLEQESTFAATTDWQGAIALGNRAATLRRDAYFLARYLGLETNPQGDTHAPGT